MTADRDFVRLIVGGMDYGGWKSVRIEAGIERQARSFTLDTARRWPGATNWFKVKPGMSCQVFIGSDLVLTGYVDATPIEYDGRDVKVGVQGRSKTADLVDCCPVSPPNQWHGQKLEAIAQAVAAPYGIEVVNQTDTGAAFQDFALQVGETCFETIDRMMRLRHVLSTDDERGRLVLIDVGSRRATTEIVSGQNVYKASAKLDFKDVFTQYVAKAQRTGLGGDYGVDVSEEEGEVDDTPDGEEIVAESKTIADVEAAKLLGRRRLLVIKQGGAADEGNCQDRVEYERAHREAKALETAYVLRGWRQASGELWAPNLMVRVRDDWIGFDQDMVIAECAYNLTEDGGQFVELTVGPVGGYVSKAAKVKKQKSGGGVSWAEVK